MQPRRVDGAGQPDPVLQVGVDRPGGVHGTPELRIADATELALAPDQGLELLLDRVVELEALGVEDLEAVVVGGVVRGRDHDPGLVRAVPGKERQGRGRDDADDVHVDAEAGRAGRDRCHEHVARSPRVLPDHDAPAGAGESLGGRAAERVGHGRFQVDIGDTADPVGAEQA